MSQISALPSKFRFPLIADSRFKNAQMYTITLIHVAARVLFTSAVLFMKSQILGRFVIFADNYRFDSRQKIAIKQRFNVEIAFQSTNLSHYLKYVGCKLGGEPLILRMPMT